MRNSILVGAILAAIASISWGAMFPVANHAFLYISPFYFTLIRYIPVAIILVILLYFIEGKRAFRTDGKGFILRSEEHTSELQSRGHLVCRLLLEKKKKYKNFIDRS